MDELVKKPLAALLIPILIIPAVAILFAIPRRREVVRVSGTASLARDPELAALSGRTVIAAEQAARYGITDQGGRRPPSHRDALGAPREPSGVVIR